MTKGELLRILKPFTDELEIMVDTGEDRLLPICDAEYRWPPGEYGFVRLRVMSELDPETLTAPDGKQEGAGSDG